MPISLPVDLVQAARAGDPADVDRLVEAVWPDAYRLANAVLGERQAAEDAAQEACINLYRTIASLRSAGAFRVWFYRIVVREATQIKRRRPPNEPIVETRAPAVDDATSIDVMRALARLPNNLRAIVVLRYFEQLSSREIASILKIPDGTVRFRLMIAKRRLRPLLDDEAPTHRAGEVRTNAI